MLVATFIVLVIVLADLWSGGLARSYARAFAVFVGGSARSTLEWISSARFFSSRRVLLAENETLRTALETLEERSAFVAVLREENTTLRSMLAIASEERGLTVPIVSSFRASPYGTFLIGAGENEGIQNGSIVVSNGGFVMGEVTDNVGASALVTSVFAPKSTVDALVSGVPIVLEGRGSENARAEAPRDARISSGDVVFAPKYGGRPIGVVGELRSEANDATKVLFIRLPVNLSSLRFVYVIREP